MNLTDLVFGAMERQERDRAKARAAAEKEYAVLLARRKEAQPGDGERMLELLPLVIPADGYDELNGRSYVEPHLRERWRHEQLRKDHQAMEDHARLMADRKEKIDDAERTRTALQDAERVVDEVVHATIGISKSKERSVAAGRVTELQEHARWLTVRIHQLDESILELRGKHVRAFAHQPR